MLSEKELKHLCELARIRMSSDEKRNKRLLSDLSDILDYFKKLKEVDTSNVESLAGGAFLSDVFRNDSDKNTDEKTRETQRKLSVEQFPKKENNYLKIPPVFGKI